MALGDYTKTTWVDGTTAITAARLQNIDDKVDEIDTLAAPLASPTFTGTPAAPTAAASTDTTQLATTAFVHDAIDSDLNVSGTAPKYACRAWVNFNGTGTVAIRASGNVTSITDNNVGDYTINFATALPDANYAVHATGSKARVNNDTTADGYVIQDTAPTSSLVRIGFVQANFSTSSALDPTYANVSIFR